MYKYYSTNSPSLKKKGFIKALGKYKLLLFLLLLLLILLLLNSSVLAVKNIVVLGESQLTADQVVSLAGISLGKNILKVDIKAAESSLEKNPWIKDAVVKREFPSQIIIDVTENKPVVSLCYMGSYILLDREKMVLDILQHYNSKYPIISGLKPTGVQEGQQIQCENDSLMDMLLNFLQQSKELGLYQNISEISLNDTNIMLFLTNHIQVKLSGDKDLVSKVSVIKAVFEDIQNKYTSGGLIDMTGDDPVLFIEH